MKVCLTPLFACSFVRDNNIYTEIIFIVIIPEERIHLSLSTFTVHFQVAIDFLHIKLNTLLGLTSFRNWLAIHHMYIINEDEAKHEQESQ